MYEEKYRKKPTKIILIKPEYNLIIKYSSSKREENVGLYLKCLNNFFHKSLLLVLVLIGYALF